MKGLPAMPDNFRSYAKFFGFRRKEKDERLRAGPDSLSTQKVKLLIPSLAGILLVITAGHYLVPAEHHIIHNILQRLYYIPVVLAAYQRGMRGGAIVSIISAVLYLPHIIFGWDKNPEYQVSQLAEIILFILIGISAGMLFEQKEANQRTIRSYEKMAMFGNLSRSIIRSLKKPVRAIRGMLMALEPMSNRNTGLASCIEIIESEIEIIENVRNDLISLVERKRLRLKKQNLNELMFQFMSEIELGLNLKGIKMRRVSQEIELPACIHRTALMNVLHQLIGSMIEKSLVRDTVTFYTGQSYSYTWLGGTVDEILLDGHDENISVIVDSQCYGEYDLIPIVNVMNNHFGDVRFRWHGNKLTEFILLFPRKLKLPWHLRDEQTPRKQSKIRKNERITVHD